MRATPLLLVAALTFAASTLVGLTAPTALAQQPPEAEVSPLGITVELSLPLVRLGERTDLVIAVRHPIDVQVNARAPLRGEAVELVAEDDPRTLALEDVAFTTFTFTFAAFDLGVHTLEPIEVTWLRADGTTGGQLVTPPPIEVLPIRDASDVTLLPLKPQATIEGGPAGWIRPARLAGLAVAAGLLAALGGFWLWRRRGREDQVAVFIPDTSAEMTARQRLDVASAVGPRSAAPDYQAYYGELAAVVRDYLTGRFDFNAAALTTTELEERMTAEGIGRWQARLVSGLLDRCDAAVFARQYPEPTSADHDLTVAFEIIELSRPRMQTAAEVEEDEAVPV